MSTATSDHTAIIRRLNDAFRRSMDRTHGRVMLTEGIAALPSDVQAMVIRKVVSFDAFDEDNDPHQEHDFGAFEIAGHKIFWKIDYYDQNFEDGSENPANPDATGRVLTIMRADEY